MKRYISVLSIGCLVFALAVASVAQITTTSPSSQVSVPHLVKFSGTVRDDAGHPRSGVAGITFALYKDQQGGAPLWLETQNVQADSKGNYTVLLGSTTAEGLPTEIFTANDARWLGVQVEGQQEQARTLLVSAPYALKALDAETVGGKPASAFQPATSGSATNSTTEQPNEIVCASGTACKTASIPVFASSGGSSKITDSIIGQSGNSINVVGAVNAQGTSGNITASQNISATGNVNAAGNVFANNVFAQNQVSGTSGSFIGTVVATGGITGANLSTKGTVSGTTGNFSGSVSAANLSTSGTVSGASGNFTGNVSAGASTGDGIDASSSQDSNFTAGVFGAEFGSTQKTVGVFGFTSSSFGAGLFGESVSGSIVGSGFAPKAGAWGDTGVAGNVGVLGTADDGVALDGQNNSAGHATLFLNNLTTSSSALVLDARGSGNGGACNIDVQGNLACSGSKSAVVPVDNGTRKVALYALEAPENWFEDFGSGQLVNGSAVISLESTFVQTVNSGMDYHVFLSPRGECEGLYIANATAANFEVRELHHGSSTVTFDYRIVARRKGYEDVRLADKTKQFEYPTPDSPRGENKVTTPVEPRTAVKRGTTGNLPANVQPVTTHN